MQKYGFICRSCLSKLPGRKTNANTQVAPTAPRRFGSVAAALKDESVSTGADFVPLADNDLQQRVTTSSIAVSKVAPEPSRIGSERIVPSDDPWASIPPARPPLNPRRDLQVNQDGQRQAAEETRREDEERKQVRVRRKVERLEHGRKRLADEIRRTNITREQEWRRERKLRAQSEEYARLPTPPSKPKPPLLIRRVPSERKVPTQVDGAEPGDRTTEVLEKLPQRFTDEYNYAPENLEFWSQFDVDFNQPTPAELASWAPAMPVATRRQEERRRALQRQKEKARKRHQEKGVLNGEYMRLGAGESHTEDSSLKSRLEQLRFMEQKSYGWFRQQMQGFEKATWHESMERYDAWKADFAELVDETDNGPEEEVSLLEGHRRRQYREQVSQLLDIKDEDSRREEWQRYIATESSEDIRDVWPQLVLACLRYFPTKVDKLIHTTWEESWRMGESVTPPWVVQDVIWFLIRHPSLKLNSGFARKLWSLMVTLMSKSPRGHLRFRQWDIFQLMDNLSTEDQVEKFYRALVEYEHPLHSNTLQQFADRLGRNIACKSTALEIIEYLVISKQLDVNSPHIGALVTTLLSFKDQQSPDDLPEVMGKPAEYFERVLELGFTPNLFTYSVLVCNICRTGSMREALNVLDIMRGQNLEPDAILYSYLLHTAKLTQDWDAMAMLLQQAASQNIQDPVVWNEPLHFVYRAFLAEARQRISQRERVPRRMLPAFDYMIKMFGRIYQPDVLRKFIPWDLDPLLHAEMKPDNANGWETGIRTYHFTLGMPSFSESEVLQPGHDTISIMLMGFMATYSNPQAAFALYRHVRKMLDAGDPDVVGFVQKTGTLLYDLVLRSMLAEKSYFGLCFGILNEMIGRSELAANSSSSGHRELRLTRQAAELPEDSVKPPRARTAAEYWHRSQQPQPETNIVFCHPPPSVHTWSILLHGLMYHKETEHAERILRLMPEYGVQPNTVSWNSMLGGYAKAQNVRMAVKTLKRLEASGVETNELTFTAFSYLHNREAGLRMMEALTKKRSTRLSTQPIRAQENDDEAESGQVAQPGLELDPGKVEAEMEAWEKQSAASPASSDVDEGRELDDDFSSRLVLDSIQMDGRASPTSAKHQPPAGEVGVDPVWQDLERQMMSQTHTDSGLKAKQDKEADDDWGLGDLEIPRKSSRRPHRSNERDDGVDSAWEDLAKRAVKDVRGRKTGDEGPESSF
jgi:pentatricopeptide repeat protein